MHLRSAAAASPLVAQSFLAMRFSRTPPQVPPAHRCRRVVMECERLLYLQTAPTMLRDPPATPHPPPHGPFFLNSETKCSFLPKIAEKGNGYKAKSASLRTSVRPSSLYNLFHCACERYL